jgi:polysaccharide export outer membrane protein
MIAAVRPVRHESTNVRPLLFAILLLASASAAAEATAPPPDYRLGAGDSVAIAVYGEPDLSLTAKVRENGRIAYPLIGELAVAGRSPAELEQELEQALDGDYLIDPKVSVSVAEYRPYFINGQVAHPGSYPYQPGMTVRKAVSLAGGLSERASERRITLIPESQKDKSQGRKVTLDEPVGPGDIITIDESFF